MSKRMAAFFLEDYTRGMAGVDPFVLTAGAQPFGSARRDLEGREFAQAFRALPAGAYQDVAGMKDSVTVRQFQTPKGTYVLYAWRRGTRFTGLNPALTVSCPKPSRQ